MVGDSHRADTLSVRQFMSIHHTDHHDCKEKRVAHSESIALLREAYSVTEHWRAEIAMSSCHSEEGIDGKEKNERFSDEGEVMIDKASLLTSVEGWPCLLVNETSVQSGFENVLTSEKKQSKQLAGHQYSN